MTRIRQSNRRIAFGVWFLLAVLLSVWSRPVRAESPEDGLKAPVIGGNQGGRENGGQRDLPGGVSATGDIGFLGRGSKDTQAEPQQTPGTTVPSVSSRGAGQETEPSGGTGQQETETSGGSSQQETEKEPGNDDDNTAREPQPKSDVLTSLGDYPVTKVDPVITGSETYEDERFSLDIPKGWVVETTGMYSSLVIRISDPQMPDRSLFLFCGIYPYLKSAQARAWYEANANILEGPTLLFPDAPVLGNLSVLSFVAELPELREFCAKYYDAGLTWNPALIPDFGRYAVMEQWDSNILSLEECVDRSIVRLRYDSPLSGENCISMLTAQMTEGEAYYLEDLDLGYNIAYVFTGMTTPAGEFSQLEGTLSRLLASLTFSKEFLAQAGAMDETHQKHPEILGRMPEILETVEDQFNRKWNECDYTLEAEVNRQHDHDRGLIRLVDIDKKEVFLADTSFYEAYDADRGAYERPNLYPVDEVDDIYYIWAVKYRIG